MKIMASITHFGSETEIDLSETEPWVVFTVGISASEKTTWAKIMFDYWRPGCLEMVCRDDFRVKYLKEKDDVIKGEIVDQMVDDGFYPCLAIDDRPRVLRGYRSKGIKTLTVGDPYIEF